jgi:hypothetical protein
VPDETSTQRGATEATELSVRDKVRLGHGGLDRWWWTVQAVSDNFAACVHQAPFQPAGTVWYTVLDWRNGVRGPCNLIGQSWGDGSYSPQECAEMLALFEAHDLVDAKLRALPPGQSLEYELTLEVSYRNRVPLQVLDVRRG